jgi:hypothetical protein
VERMEDSASTPSYGCNFEFHQKNQLWAFTRIDLRRSKNNRATLFRRPGCLLEKTWYDYLRPINFPSHPRGWFGFADPFYHILHFSKLSIKKLLIGTPWQVNDFRLESCISAGRARNTLSGRQGCGVSAGRLPPSNCTLPLFDPSWRAAFAELTRPARAPRQKSPGALRRRGFFSRFAIRRS